MNNIKRILELSVEKNGEIPLTNKHLLNILRMADRYNDFSDRRSDLMGAYAEIQDAGDR